MKQQSAVLLLLVQFLVLHFSTGTLKYSRRKTEFRIRKEHLNVPGRENIYFLTVNEAERARAVDSVCPPHWCSFTVEEEKWKGDRLIVTFSVTIVRAVEPWMAGELSFCWGDRNSFRLLPTYSRHYCSLLSRLKPSSRVLEPFSLTLYTWFMDRDNHDGMRLHGSTEVVLPLLPDRVYDVPVYILVFHEATRDRVKCTLQRPYTVTPIPLETANQNEYVRHVTRHLTRVVFMVGATPEKTGTYTVSCKGQYFYPPDNDWFPTDVEKTITLRFKHLPKIELVGHRGNTVYLPHSNETGAFHVDIFSTSDIVTVDVSRSDGVKRKRESELIPEFLGQNYYQVRAQYKVNIPWVDAGLTGTYSIKMSNKNGESATLEIKIHRVEEMMVLVSPERLEAEEETSVSLHCLVLTDLPANTTVSWQMRSPQDLAESRAVGVAGNRRALELTLPSANISQSGTYTCVADNGFQRVSADVSLTIFPRGAPDHRRQRKATWVERMNCDKVVDAETLDSVKTAGKITVGLVVFSAVAAMAAVGTVVAWKVYKRLKEKGVFEAKEPTKNSTETANEADDETQQLLQSLETHGKRSPKKTKAKKKQNEAEEKEKRREDRREKRSPRRPREKEEEKKSSKSRTSGRRK